VATAIIITARLNAIPITEILITGRENEEWPLLLKVRRVAINKPVFTNDECMDSKILNIALFSFFCWSYRFSAFGKQKVLFLT
jgi:hypothetical protein